MIKFSEFLHKIYRAAGERTVCAFPDVALELLHSALPFHAARWMTVESMEKGALLHSLHLYNESTAMVLDWDNFNYDDNVIKSVTSRFGPAFDFQAPVAGQSAVRDNPVRNGYQNSSVIIEDAATHSYIDTLSLYRSKNDAQFSDSERQMIETLMPHMTETLIINRMLSFKHPAEERDPAYQCASAVARDDGVVQSCGPEFSKLVHQEWPEWRSVRLPDGLRRAALRPDNGGFVGASIKVSVQKVGKLLYLRARKVSPLARLSQRELEVAQLYGLGRTHKEIAEDMKISPTTVRTFLQHIYNKLNINDKATLATLLVNSDFGTRVMAGQSGHKPPTPELGLDEPRA